MTTSRPDGETFRAREQNVPARGRLQLIQTFKTYFNSNILLEMVKIKSPSLDSVVLLRVLFWSGSGSA